MNCYLLIVDEIGWSSLTSIGDADYYEFPFVDNVFMPYGPLSNWGTAIIKAPTHLIAQHRAHLLLASWELNDTSEATRGVLDGLSRESVWPGMEADVAVCLLRHYAQYVA